MKKISVAIDGPAGAGKSSVAKTAASVLGYVYIDTGAMYRSVAVYAIENGIDIAGERQRLIKCLGDIDISLRNDGGRQTVYLNDVDVTERIRTADASMGASAVAVITEVREKLVSEQKAMARDGGVIMDGRDIGTSVLPGAELKIYLTASVAERAKRRYNENIERGMECDYDEIERDVRKRDENDMTREVSPLRKADDAVLLDTSDMTFDEVVGAVTDMIREREADVL